MDIRLDEGFATSVYETEYNDAKTFLDKSYEEVYSVWDSSAPAYSELHFSTKDGVVAFKDKHEVLWTLSHYVE